VQMTVRRAILLSLCTIPFLVLLGCGSNPVPKPRGYFRIDFPEKTYQQFDSTYPFSFEYPTYATFVPDTEPGAEPYWFNLVFKGYKAQVHISYKPIKGNADMLLEDGRELVYKHTVKADAITEQFYSNPERRVYGMLYQIKGDAASPMQFFVTDSTHHFLRGALYFNVEPNKDSLDPAIRFFSQDVVRFIETLSWK